MPEETKILIEVDDVYLETDVPTILSSGIVDAYGFGEQYFLPEVHFRKM